MKKMLSNGGRGPALCAFLILLMVLALAACSSDNTTIVTTMVGPGGGTLRFSGVTLVIPPGALDSDRIIGVSQANDYPADSNIIGSPAIIGPSQAFLKPVTITMPFDLPAGVNPMNATLATLQGGAWTPIPDTQVDVEQRTVTASVLYLSTYTPYWYKAPTPTPSGYYFHAYLVNGTGSAYAAVDNTLYHDDGKSAAFGFEGDDPATWTPYSYTLRPDGFINEQYVYPAPDGNFIQGFGFSNAASKVDAYFQTSVVSDFSFFTFGFEKPADDYQPSLAGLQYFVGGYQSSLTDTQQEVFANQLYFDTSEAGRLVDSEGVSHSFTYTVAAGGQVTLIIAYDSDQRTLGLRLSPDGSLVTYGYKNTEAGTAGLVAGARLSTGRTNADLSGVYHTILYQPGETDKRVRYRTITFDGNGHGTYVTYDETLEGVLYTGTLTYSVNDDGTFTLNMTHLSEGFDEPSILSSDGNVFVNSDPYGNHHTLTIGVKKTTTVGSLGATIQESGATLSIPPGALDRNSIIDISPASGYPGDDNIIGRPIRIAPFHVFQKPVSLTMPFELPGGADLQNASLAVLQAGSWISVPGTTVDTNNKTVRAPLLYLSLCTPYWYEPGQTPTGYYVNSSLQNLTGGVQAAVDNTLYNDDGRTAAFGAEGTDPATWTPYDYTLRPDGFINEQYVYPAPDGNFIQGFGIFNSSSKVDAYFQTGAAASYTSILFGFEKPPADYQPSLAGKQYFVGGFRSKLMGAQQEVFANQLYFDIDKAGRLVDSEGVSHSFTYTVAAGGQVTLTVTYDNGPQTLGLRLSLDGSLAAFGYKNVDTDTAGLVVGARLSTEKTNADLSGAYHTMLYLPDSPDSHVLYRSMTFDGQGGGSYVTYDKKLEEISDNGTLTYSVNDDGVFTMTLSTVSEGQSETCVLSPDNNVFIDPDYYGTPSFTIGVKKEISILGWGVGQR